MPVSFQRTARLLGLLITGFFAACGGDSSAPTGNNPPGDQTVAVEINSPANGIMTTQEALVEYSGSAIVGRNTPLEGESLIWRSDRDGVIGVGVHFKRSGLSIGTHTISLAATAPGGQRGEARIQLINQPQGNGMTVTIAAPLAGKRVFSNELVELRGEALDSNGQPISSDHALRWESSLDQVLGNGRVIDPGGLTPGLHQIKLFAQGANGESARASVDLFVEFFSSPVRAEILVPVTNTQVPYGDPVTFSGSAVDGQGNPIVGPNLLWTSSMDGVVGVGETCIVNNLRRGTHRITMRAGTTPSDITAVSIDLVVR